MHALIAGVDDLFASVTNRLLNTGDQRYAVVDSPATSRRSNGRYRRSLRPVRRRASTVRRPLAHGRFSPGKGGFSLPGTSMRSAKLVTMMTMQASASGSSRVQSLSSRTLADETDFQPSGKRLPTLTRSELANLFGVSASELGRLGRQGLFHRLGQDRYQLDCRRSVSLLSGKNRGTPPRSRRWGKHPVIPTSLPRWQGPGYTAHNTTLGIAEFYQQHGRELENGINILNVPDLRCATLAGGMFLAGGLQRNERGAVVTFEHPRQMLSRLTDIGISLDNALQTEQLVYLYYKPDVAHSLSISANYRELFKEVEQLGGGKVQRLVLFNVDALINANSEHLVHTSLHQLIYAANQSGVSLLGIFVASGHTGKLLDDGCRAILPGYYVLG